MRQLEASLQIDLGIILWHADIRSVRLRGYNIVIFLMTLQPLLE